MHWREQAVQYLHQWGKYFKEAAPVGALSQIRTRASQFKQCFLKINGGIFVLTNSWTDIYLELGGLATDFYGGEVVCRLSWKLP